MQLQGELRRMRAGVEATPIESTLNQEGREWTKEAINPFCTISMCLPAQVLCLCLENLSPYLDIGIFWHLLLAGAFLLSSFCFLNWSIVDLQCCLNYCCTAKWFSDSIHTHTHTFIFENVLFHYDFSQDTQYSSLYYANPNLPLFPPTPHPLRNHQSVLCVSVSVF